MDVSLLQGFILMQSVHGSLDQLGLFPVHIGVFALPSPSNQEEDHE
jgi:hypothetical protein